MVFHDLADSSIHVAVVEDAEDLLLDGLEIALLLLDLRIPAGSHASHLTPVPIQCPNAWKPGLACLVFPQRRGSFKRCEQSVRAALIAATGSLIK